MSKMQMIVLIYVSGMHLMIQNESATRKQDVSYANGIIETVPEQPDTIPVSSFTGALE